MKILLTHGYFLHEDEKEKLIMRPYPPLGILYISAYLEEQGIDNEVYDTTFRRKAEFMKYLLEEKPEVVAIYTNLMTKLNVIEIIRFIRKSPELKETVIVLGGPDVTYNSRDYLVQGCDFVVIGEGEETMKDLLQWLDNQTRSPEKIPGIAFLSQEGKLITTPSRQKIREIDDLPFPNRKKIDLKQYLNTWRDFHGQSTISVSTQRGCPYTCKWCSTAVYGQSYRRRSPEKVVEELLFLKNQYNPDSIWFVDDVFTVSHKWLEAFVKELKDKNLKIPFECITRADRMNEEVIGMLKEAGCFRVWIGAESGSQKIINAMDRRVDVKQVQDMIQLTRRHGIEAGTFIMLGYPGETQQDIELTVQHLKNSDPDHFTITIAYPIKGTGLYSEVEHLQTNSLKWNESTDRDRDFKRTYSRKYYDYAVKHVVNEVNYHKKHLAKKHLSLAGIQLFLKSRLAKTAMNWVRILN